MYFGMSFRYKVLTFKFHNYLNFTVSGKIYNFSIKISDLGEIKFCEHFPIHPRFFPI